MTVACSRHGLPASYKIRPPLGRPAETRKPRGDPGAPDRRRSAGGAGARDGGVNFSGFLRPTGGGLRGLVTGNLRNDAGAKRLVLLGVAQRQLQS
jgi:hypothetical protein